MKLLVMSVADENVDTDTEEKLKKAFKGDDANPADAGGKVMTPSTIG
jgi:hypothetical protein